MTTEPNNAAPTLEQLKAMLAGFSAADVKKLLKETEANKPTMLSLTCEALVAAQLAGPVLTDAVTKATTALARTASLLKADEDANGSSVAQIIRICVAHDAAMTKAGYQWSKPTPIDPDAPIAASEPVPATEPEKAPETAPVAPPVADAAKAPKQPRMAA